MRRRVRQYSLVMGLCLVLFAGALPVYYAFGPGWAVAVCAVASVLPPVAATLGNLADPRDPQDRGARFGPNADTSGRSPGVGDPDDDSDDDPGDDSWDPPGGSDDPRSPGGAGGPR